MNLYLHSLYMPCTKEKPILNDVLRILLIEDVSLLLLVSCGTITKSTKIKIFTTLRDSHLIYFVTFVAVVV